MEHAALAACPLFAGLKEPEVAAAVSSAQHRIVRYGRGDVVFRAGDEATHVGIVLSGSVGVRKVFAAGDQLRVTRMRPGDLLGEGAVFSCRGTYPCDVAAEERAEVMLLGRDGVLELLRRDGRVMENLVRELATAAYRLQWRIELLSHSGIKQKVAFYLLSRGDGVGGRKTVRIPETVTAWALELNVSRTSLHRELRALADQGVVDVDPPSATVLGAGRLGALLG